MRTKLLRRLRKESCCAYWAIVETDSWGVNHVKIIGPGGVVCYNEQWEVRRVMERGIQDHIQRTLAKHRRDYILERVEEIRLQRFADALMKKLNGRIG